MGGGDEVLKVRMSGGLCEQWVGSGWGYPYTLEGKWARPVRVARATVRTVCSAPDAGL